VKLQRVSVVSVLGVLVFLLLFAVAWAVPSWLAQEASGDGKRTQATSPAQDAKSEDGKAAARVREVERTERGDNYLQLGDDVLICWGRAALPAPKGAPHVRTFDFQFAKPFDGLPTVTTGFGQGCPSYCYVFGIYSSELDNTRFSGALTPNGRANETTTGIDGFVVEMSYMAIGKPARQKAKGPGQPLPPATGSTSGAAAKPRPRRRRKRRGHTCRADVGLSLPPRTIRNHSATISPCGA
jgi:hypothetical protein